VKIPEYGEESKAQDSFKALATAILQAPAEKKKRRAKSVPSKEGRINPIRK
jgi:hypothetical protein